MEANVIKAQIDEAWRDACASWKDEYTSRYKTAVISELENTIDHIQKTSRQLDEAINTVLSSLREFD
jgi:gamma-glutamyl phosphate reductase